MEETATYVQPDRFSYEDYDGGPTTEVLDESCTRIVSKDATVP
jgi:hypothetical protein